MKEFTRKQQEYIDKLLATIDGQVIVIEALDTLAIASRDTVVARVEYLEEIVADQSVLIDEYKASNEALRTAVKALAMAV